MVYLEEFEIQPIIGLIIVDVETKAGTNGVQQKASVGFRSSEY